ncbi:MAG: hypothetical protein A2V90_03110 [Gammaproteobacteria bacterium RBG_16_57_12]|nr:MAG: hypothetical protein A2V90_03110 [Gammaproteobacteria bacterium RBG_16_57_12]
MPLMPGYTNIDETLYEAQIGDNTMKFKRLAQMLLAAIMVTLTLTAHAGFTMIEDAIEASTFSLEVDKEGYGFIMARNCPSCPEVKVLINEGTRIMQNQKSRTVNHLRERANLGATIIYNLQTRVATKIFW